MTNQEAMRGRAREFIKSRWLIPGAKTIVELMVGFYLQEVASRDARIAELKALLRKALPLTLHSRTDCRFDCLHCNIDEALKEQP